MVRTSGILAGHAADERELVCFEGGLSCGEANVHRRKRQMRSSPLEADSDLADSAGVAAAAGSGSTNAGVS